MTERRDGREERRLAAILAADMVGYSRLMEADERGTLAALKAHRAELIDPTIAQHNGRIVKTTGDGMLAEFASVVDAVAGAVAIQRAMAARNEAVPEERRIRFRVGINLGDIIVDGDDIYGDGVNIAARLEELAEPGGICISGTAYDQLKQKVDVGYEFLGEQQVKNIAEPVRVYRALLDPEEAGKVIGFQRKPRRRWLAMATTAALVAVIVFGGLWWWLEQQPDFEPADPAKMAFTLPKKPSIAVLPFDNLSGDPAQDYLGDGLTENIIAVLSTSPDLFVIARNSSFTYKGKPVQVQEVAERFGVRYVLEGSVQRQGEKLRITAQLVDAIDGRHLWAERYDRQLKDLFALQDDITQEILVAMHVKLTIGTYAKEIWEDLGKDPEAYRQIVQGRAQFQTYGREGHREAERLFTEVFERHPESAAINIRMGWLYWQKVQLGLTKNPKATMAKAREFAQKSIDLNDQSSAPHVLLAALELMARRHESAVAHADRGLELAPADSLAIAIAGWIKLGSGQPGEGVELSKRAMRNEPVYPQWIPTVLCIGYMMLGRHDEARAIANGVLASPAEDVRVHPAMLRNLTAMAMFEGDEAGARQFLERLLTIQPKYSVSRFRRTFYYLKDREFLERYLDALRQAGLPENPPLALPDKPSIAVLPFQNMSGDPEQAYFADGMAEDIITDLSKLAGLFVIARNSSFQFKGKNTDVRTIARELGVRYVLEGSVRRAGDQVRINAQLIDALSGGHLWAERYDGTLADVFALQDRVTARIVEALSLKLTDAEKTVLARKGTENAEAYDVYLKGWASYLKDTPDDYVRAVARLKLAITLDPGYDRARAALAQVYSSAAGRAWLEPLGFRLLTGARIAVTDQLDRIKEPGPVALRVQAEIAREVGNFERAVALMREALALDPNDVDSHITLAEQLRRAGKVDEAIATIEKAKRLDPKYPGNFDTALAYAYFAEKAFERAAEFAGRAVARNADDFEAYLVLLAAYGHQGKGQAAAPVIAALQAHRTRVGQPPFFPGIILSSTRGPSATSFAQKQSLYDGLLAADFPTMLKPDFVSEQHRLGGEQIRALMIGRRISGFSSLHLSRTRPNGGSISNRGEESRGVV